MDNVHSLQSSETLMEEARAWVLVFNGDTPPSNADIQAMREWAARSSAHRAALQQAEDFWCEAELLSQLSVSLPKTAFSRGSLYGLFCLLKAGLLTLTTRVQQHSLAASFSFALIALMLGGLWWPSNQAVGNGVYSTAIGEQAVLILKDNSVVHLDTHSQVHIDYQQEVRRITLQRGKAHFDVAKNLQRPFEVYAREGLVRAVGTAFSVFLAEREVEVIVDEGRVDLARLDNVDVPQGGSGAVELPASGTTKVSPTDVPSGQFDATVFLSLGRGEGARFDREQQSLAELDEQAMARELAWRQGQLVFVRDPLSQVVTEVSRYTSVKIDIVDPSLGKLVVGGRFQIGELDALFEVLEIGFGVRVAYISDQHVELSLAAQ